MGDQAQESPQQGTPENANGSSHLHGTGDQGRDSLPIAQRRTRRTICIPLRYRKDVPQPLASLPPPELILPLDEDTIISSPTADLTLPIEQPFEEASASAQRMRRLDSPRNAFQVFRRYHAVKFPSHDPDEGIPFTHFSDISEKATDVSLYSPYPNKSSFLLGEWFWKDGAQKSIQDFSALLKVLKNPDFSLDDIRETRWHYLNKQLGNSDESEGPWLSDVDAGWKEESISLTIPFHKRLGNPGNHIFEAGTFHRRSIVSIIRERLAGADAHHLHYEPYELYWQPRSQDPPVRVFGELYTSPEFHRVHQELQSSPPEPGCDLPRVVIGLMLSSDVTHLTQFSSAKLWPVYMFFGNDSKYRRCKPSCQLCNHIAYLQKVSSVSR